MNYLNMYLYAKNVKSVNSYNMYNSILVHGQCASDIITKMMTIKEVFITKVTD